MVKAKQVEYLINSLPQPEPEEEQVRRVPLHEIHPNSILPIPQARRLAGLEEEMVKANENYLRAVERASASHPIPVHQLRSLISLTGNLHQRISEILRSMLDETDHLASPG